MKGQGHARNPGVQCTHHVCPEVAADGMAIRINSKFFIVPLCPQGAKNEWREVAGNGGVPVAYAIINREACR